MYVHWEGRVSRLWLDLIDGDVAGLGPPYFPSDRIHQSLQDGKLLHPVGNSTPCFRRPVNLWLRQRGLQIHSLEKKGALRDPFIK